MESDFVTKTDKPSGKEYLEAPLEDVIDRANKSTHESEIPFVSAVLSAKANRDQRQAAKQTFCTAIASVVVAILSLTSTVLIYCAQSQQEDSLQNEFTSLSSRYEALNQKLQQIEIDRARLAEQIAALMLSQATTTTLLQTAIGIMPKHTNFGASKKPLVEKSSKPK